MRMSESPLALQQEMDSLQQRFADLEHDSILAHYAFIPAIPQPIAYFTANFLHGGWLHIIGNMWFLWLAGTILEDTWGTHYLPSVLHAIGSHGHGVPRMVEPREAWPPRLAPPGRRRVDGAFLVRFPKTKIEMIWLFGFGFRSCRFHARAYCFFRYGCL